MSSTLLGDVEAVLLTGGASTRMGEDKSRIYVNGSEMGRNIAIELAKACNPITILGRQPIEGFGFIPDAEGYQGPLVALAAFSPSRPLVFIASCDLPCFESSLIALLRSRVENGQAVVPVSGDSRQPLCALYRAEAIGAAKELVQRGERRMMALLDHLDVRLVSAEELPNPKALRSANTREELRTLLDS